MLVKELIAELQKHNPEEQVTIQDDVCMNCKFDLDEQDIKSIFVRDNGTVTLAAFAGLGVGIEVWTVKK